MTKDEALKLAEYWETRAKDLQTWVDENDFVEFGYRPEGLKREQADQRRTAAELRRLHEVNQELLKVLRAILLCGTDWESIRDLANAYLDKHGEQA